MTARRGSGRGRLLGHGRDLRTAWWLLVATLASAGPSAAQPALTIERLLKEGWEIAGYAGTVDIRASLLLFRKKDVPYLVQCSNLYDVTRAQRVVVNCYELR